MRRLAVVKIELLPPGKTGSGMNNLSRWWPVNTGLCYCGRREAERDGHEKEQPEGVERMGESAVTVNPKIISRPTFPQLVHTRVGISSVIF